MAAAGAAFLDPLCGSGTLPIEAALIAAERAPGLLRDYWGFTGWRGHDAALWERLLAEARGRARGAIASALRGSDRDRGALHNAALNAQRAGVAGLRGFQSAAGTGGQPRGAGVRLVGTK